MEIQLTVPVIELKYTNFTRFLGISFFGLAALGLATFWWWSLFGLICFIALWPLGIFISCYKNYRITGKIILGYHHITVNGECFLIKDMQDINVRIAGWYFYINSPVIRSETDHFISFDGHSYRLLLNEDDIKAARFLVKVWEETYRLKVGHKV